jgi:pimeloyl-ACP methyl ester carboxylesterase
MLNWRDSGPVGGGDPLVFLHAFPLNQSMWDPQYAHFARSRRVITLDWPGFGQSPLRELGDGVGLEPYAASLLRLLDHLEIERATICGLSMGGYAALALFRLAPERVGSLVFCDTRATADSAAARTSRYEMVANLAQEGVAGVESLVRNMVPRLVGDTTLANHHQVVMQIESMIRQNGADGIARGLRGLAERPDSSDLLPAIGARANDRALLVVGNEDKLTPPSEMRLMSEAISGSGFVIIEGAGHLPNLEQSDSFNQALEDFLP